MVKDCGMTFSQFFDMTKKEKEAFEKKHPFEYSTLDEYTQDVAQWLCESSWHCSEDEAKEAIKQRREWIKECFDNHTPVDLAGAEAGYCCG